MEGDLNRKESKKKKGINQISQQPKSDFNKSKWEKIQTPQKYIIALTCDGCLNVGIIVPFSTSILSCQMVEKTTSNGRLPDLADNFFSHVINISIPCSFLTWDAEPVSNTCIQKFNN